MGQVQKQLDSIESRAVAALYCIVIITIIIVLL